jgi:Sulfotransferase family
VFLLSLPRSGSTLVQRVLASHEAIDTTPEPWVVLPQIYAMRERGAYAEYGQVPSSRAIREFASRLPGGEEDYRDELRRFLLGLYSRASDGRARYFVDKTPRYHYVIEDLFRLFPEAKYVFLWRHPIAVAASIAQTWARGRWTLDRWRADLFGGLANMVDSYDRHAQASHAVRYEQLVSNGATAWRPVFDYLELPFEPSLLHAFGSLTLEARMGDPTGSRRYRELSTEPVEKWRGVVSNPLRKRWCREYLAWIGERRLSIMGYDLSTLTRELDAIPTDASHLASDAAWGAYSSLASVRRASALRLLTRRRRSRRA